jgi:hypothetical protein
MSKEESSCVACVWTTLNYQWQPACQIGVMIAEAFRRNTRIFALILYFGRLRIARMLCISSKLVLNQSAIMLTVDASPLHSHLSRPEMARGPGLDGCY